MGWYQRNVSEWNLHKKVILDDPKSRREEHATSPRVGPNPIRRYGRIKGWKSWVIWTCWSIINTREIRGSNRTARIYRDADWPRRDLDGFVENDRDHLKKNETKSWRGEYSRVGPRSFIKDWRRIRHRRSIKWSHQCFRERRWLDSRIWSRTWASWI